MSTILGIGLIIIGLSIVFAILYKKSVIDKKINELNSLEDAITKSKLKAEEIIKDAERYASARGKEIELKAKENAYIIKEEAEKEIKNAKNDLVQKEARLTKKEETLDNKIERLEVKRQELEKTTEELVAEREEIENIKAQQETELERISGLSKSEAKDILIAKLRDDLTHETAIAIREFEGKLEDEKDRISRRILSTAIGKASAEYVADATVSVVNLPNDEMKGRIIGREGRNIRAIEALTGVDIIIDDTPEAVVLSSFDGVKREIARLAIEKLITDGRIHPGKIEEVVNKAKKDIDKEIMDAGEEALIEL